MRAAGARRGHFRASDVLRRTAESGDTESSGVLAQRVRRVIPKGPLVRERRGAETGSAVRTLERTKIRVTLAPVSGFGVELLRALPARHDVVGCCDRQSVRHDVEVKHPFLRKPQCCSLDEQHRRPRRHEAVRRGTRGT